MMSITGECYGYGMPSARIVDGIFEESARYSWEITASFRQAVELRARARDCYQTVPSLMPVIFRGGFQLSRVKWPSRGSLRGSIL